MPSLPAFRNALTRLRNLDQHELIAAGLHRMRQPFDWSAFREDPVRWFLAAPQDEQRGVFDLISRRQP